MKRLFVFLLSVLVAFLWLLTTPPAQADLSHARIVRLSLVQGDVRFTREFHKDSLDDSKANWEVAPLNLPIREGYALATDANGRAEVEFENGAMAFLSANTLIEFYDLSLDEGAHITRLILRQGSAIFYVHPAPDDYFSVTGGDFSVEADGRTRFRLDNFDDGSNVSVELGRINVLRGKASKPLEKGQSYSLNINEGQHAAPVIGRAADDDDFDKWVSGRIDNVATATTYASQYVSSPDYASGFADLYNYGSFYNVAGYGYGWQPFGAGLGWSPFASGGWYSDPFFGWNFISSAPWGWLPYHYGSWMFNPIYGWLWMPTGFGFGGPMYYSPVNAVWVRNGTTTGLVPLGPNDTRGKPAMNLPHGIYALNGNALATTPTAVVPGEKWSVIKNPPHGTLAATTLAPATTPARVSRTILTSNAGSRPVTLSRDSSIVYDGTQHRFVNNDNPPKATVEDSKEATSNHLPGSAGATKATVKEGSAAHPPSVPSEARRTNMPARPRISPPEPPASGGHSSGHSGWEEVQAPRVSNSSHTVSSAPAGHSGGGHH
ncbi:MAG TPA: FecR family protein [Verrucomicrobiae bacterium]|nr:FecR family protein [Verrucomicrobiae bacterium]